MRGRSLGRGERAAEDGVRAEVRFVRRAVRFDHPFIQRALILGIHAAQRLGELVPDIVHRFAHALAQPGLATVAQLDGLEAARRGARRHRRAAEGGVFERDVDLDGGIAARVEDLPRGDVGDPSAAHSLPLARS